MKKRIAIIFAVVSVIAVSLFLSSCFKNYTVIKDDEKQILLIELKEDAEISEGTSLLQYMNELSENGEFTFTIENTMVTSINGVSNTLSSYWMLYTDDAANSNKDWGTIEYKGKTYDSSTLGASDLKIKAGCTYIWSYQTF